MIAAKDSDITDRPTLQNINDLEFFLGFTNYAVIYSEVFPIAMAITSTKM